VVSLPDFFMREQKSLSTSTRLILGLVSCLLVAATNRSLVKSDGVRLATLGCSLAFAVGALRTPRLTPSPAMIGSPQDPPKYNTEPLTELATDAAKFPHVMLIGKTGSGKTTLAMWLASLAPGKRFAIAPHLDPAKLETEWAACHGVWGGGRNYGSEDEEPIRYADLVEGKILAPSAFQILRCLLEELDRRYKSTEGFDSHEVHNWLIDETPAVARSLDKHFGDLLAPQLYEARKVGIRLWIMTQNDNVQSLRIKGEGKMRDNFTYIYCGKQAPARLRSLKRCQPALEQDIRWCVVDESVAVVPGIQEMEVEPVPGRAIGQFPARGAVKLPLASSLKHREPTEAEIQAYVSSWSNLKDKNPGISKTEVLKAWGFSGRNYGAGVELLKTLNL
jgi:energy-coupling factor transporter ATP-binding protein EcfA2